MPPVLMGRARKKEKTKNPLGQELAETQEKNSCVTLSSADGIAPNG